VSLLIGVKTYLGRRFEALVYFGLCKTSAIGERRSSTTSVRQY
jgi:hypothetical protein